MNYRFEPTGEVRLPAFDELIEVDGEVIRSIDKQPSMELPIYRRVPHEDTSCEVAFARMYAAIHQLSYGQRIEGYDLTGRYIKGERSPELTAEMQALTEKMKGIA